MKRSISKVANTVAPRRLAARKLARRYGVSVAKIERLISEKSVYFDYGVRWESAADVMLWIEPEVAALSGHLLPRPVPCEFCERVGQRRKLAGAEMFLCARHAADTRDGHQIARLVRWAGGWESFWTSLRTALFVILKKDEAWLAARKECEQGAGLTTEKAWNDYRKSLDACWPDRDGELVVEGDCSPEVTLINAVAYALSALREQFHAASHTARAKARRRSKSLGRPRNSDSAHVARARKLIAAGMTLTAAARKVQMSPATLSRRLRTL